MLKTESYKKGILISTALNVFTKGIAFLNILVIAYYFGTTIESDLYFYIFSTVTLVAAFINGIDLAVIIPEGMHLEEKEGGVSAMQFYNFFGYLYIIIGLLLFLILLLFSVPVFSSISAFKSSVLNQHHSLLFISSALPLFLILSNYLTSVLTTLKYFTLPLIANGLAFLAGLAALIVFHKSAGISAALTGLVAGYMLNVILLVAFMYVKLKWRFTFSLKKFSKRIKINLLSVQLGNLAWFAFNYGVIVLLSSLAPGIYSAYNYSMQVVNIPIILIVTQTAAVAGIKFNELAAKNQHEQLNKFFQQTLGVLLFFIVPVCFLTWLYADVIVKFLFFRSRFTTASTKSVIFFIKYLIFLLPCLSINVFLSRLLMAIKKVNQSFYYQIGFNSIMLLIIFISTSMFNLNGFIWGFLAGNYLYFTIICIFLVKQLMPYIEYDKFLKLFLQIILINLPLCIISFLFFKHLIFILPFIYIILLFFINRVTNTIPNLNFNILKLTKQQYT